MHGWGSKTTQRLLDGLIPKDLYVAFEKLVDSDGCRMTEAEELVGDSRLIEDLIDCGMAHVSSASPDPPNLVPAPPELALQGLLRKIQQQLLTDCERLMESHRRLSRVDQERPRDGGVHHRLVEVVTDRAEISRLSYALVNTARDDWMSLENTRFEIPLDDATTSTAPPAFASSVRCRAIYESTAMEDTAAARTIRDAMNQGEQARLLPRIGMKMKLADRSVAMLPLTPTGMDGALVIRSAVVVGALREYFELLWERAMPVGTEPESSTGLPQPEEQVLPLLAQGLTDEAIAHRLRVSLPTVQRRLASLKKRLAVDTRIAIVVAAMRRGWIR